MAEWVCGERGKARSIELHVLEDVAVKIVGAGLRGMGSGAAAYIGEFGIEILVRLLHFFYRIECRIDHDDAEDWILVSRAVQLIAHRVEQLAVNDHLYAVLRVFVRGVLPADLGGARIEQFHRLEVADRKSTRLNSSH